MDFNTVDVDGQPPTLVENTYGKLERRFAPTIAGVCERGTLPTDRIAMRELLAFVASQATRTRRIREMQQRFYSDAHVFALRTRANNKRAFMKHLREMDGEVSKISDDEAEELFASLGERVNSKGVRFEFEQTKYIGDTLELAAELEDILARRCWILGRPSDGTAFVTTDDPVQLQPAGRGRPTHPLWSPGFDDENTNVIVTLSPRLVLIGLSYVFTARARVRLSRREVAAINTDLALSARRFIYSTEPRFAQIGEDGSVVQGPTEMLRRKEAPPAEMGFFSSGA